GPTASDAHVAVWEARSNRCSWRKHGSPGRDQPKTGRGSVQKQSPDAPQVAEGGGQEVDPGIRILDPVNRHLMYSHMPALCSHQELGVEKPRVISDQGQEVLRHVGADRLESALRIGEASPKG